MRTYRVSIANLKSGEFFVRAKSSRQARSWAAEYITTVELATETDLIRIGREGLAVNDADDSQVVE